MGTRRRRKRGEETYRPKRQKAETPPEAAQVDNAQVVKTLKDVKPVEGEYIVKVRRGKITVEGENGETKTIEVKGGGNVDTLLDAQTAKAFSLLKGPIAIEQRGDNLRVTETTGRSPTSFSVNIRKPREDFTTREVIFGKPATYSGKQRIEVVTKGEGNIATLEKDRSGDWIVYRTKRSPGPYGKSERVVLKRASSLQDAKRFARNLSNDEEAKTT